MTSRCECDICNQGRLFSQHMETLRTQGLNDPVKFFDDMYSDLCHTKMDLDVANAVIAGTWPSSSEVIANARWKKS